MKTNVELGVGFPEGTKPDKDMACYICNSALRSRGEMDHFPLAKRHGGTFVRPICINCHDEKDRYFLKLDSPEAFECLGTLWSKASTGEKIILTRMFNLILDQGALIDKLAEKDEEK
tara:strand:- start:460 stop:810 length:351 start_codon:yes stop_codon:yes gene_type:complete